MTPVKLPELEGEWERVGYEFHGEPGCDAIITVYNWPGSQNLVMYRRAKKAKGPQFPILGGDSVILDDLGCGIVTYACYDYERPEIYMHNSIGVSRRIERDQVVELWRGGRKVFPTAPREAD